jgi:hypothetical protein
VVRAEGGLSGSTQPARVEERERRRGRRRRRRGRRRGMLLVCVCASLGLLSPFRADAVKQQKEQQRVRVVRACLLCIRVLGGGGGVMVVCVRRAEGWKLE